MHLSELLLQLATLWRIVVKEAQPQERRVSLMFAHEEAFGGAGGFTNPTLPMKHFVLFMELLLLAVRRDFVAHPLARPLETILSTHTLS